MELRSSVPLAPYTSLKIGGPAEYLVEVRTREELRLALREAAERQLPVTVIGGGTNVLVADAGIHGIVVLMRMRGIRRQGDALIAEAGTPMAELVGRSVEEGLAGLSWAGGLPGTVGGAVFGNAGTFGRSVGETIREVEVILPDGTTVTRRRDECRFGYRSSVFRDEPAGEIILSATFALQPGDPSALRREMLDAIAFRNAHHPSPSSAGSFFKNPDLPEGHRVPLDAGEVRQWFGRVPAGWLIERAGLKGMRIGGAVVSTKHANFVTNAGGATAADVQRLASLIRERVAEMFGVTLEEEVRFLR